MSIKYIRISNIHGPINPLQYTSIAQGTWAIGETPYQGLQPLSFNNTFTSQLDPSGNPYFIVDPIDPTHIKCMIPGTYTASIILTSYPYYQGNQPNMFLYTNIMVNDTNACDIWYDPTTNNPHCPTISEQYDYSYTYTMNTNDYFTFLLFNDNQWSSTIHPVAGTISITS